MDKLHQILNVSHDYLPNDCYYNFIYECFITITIQILICVTLATCYICNMGRSDLPDMYARARGRTVLEGECRHIRQITTVHVTYVM